MESIGVLTRKGATCSDLLSCLYGLKPIELQVFYEVARRGPSTVDDVSVSVERDRTTTHRCLSKLASAGLVYREVSSLKGGGYYHAYRVVDIERIKEEARARVKEVAESLERLVENFDRDFALRLKETAG